VATRERDRLKVVAALAERRLRQREAGQLVKLSERQVRRILARYRAQGDAGSPRRPRGRPSNRRLPEAVRRRVMGRVVRQYRDFGPTLAVEKLQEAGLGVSRETLPEEMRRRLGLMDLAEALRKIHQPKSMREVHEARRRLVFSEFFLMELAVPLRRRCAAASHNAPAIPVGDKVEARIRARFPYTFTGAQDRAIGQIRADLARDPPIFCKPASAYPCSIQ